MLTSGYFHHLLQLMTLPVNVRNICVFLAPVFSANTAVATYFFTGQVVEERGAKLFAAAFVAIVPSYISRSCGGSYGTFLGLDYTACPVLYFAVCVS
eukprot:SAG31_NODE_225_length_19846_cov_19.057983_24_plen_97_part_00